MPILLIIAAVLILLAGLAAIMWARRAPSLAGIVGQYLLTPHGEVDGLLLQDGTVVRFPPHLGTALVELAKPGDEVAVVGFLGPMTPYGLLALTANYLVFIRKLFLFPPP